MTNSFHSGGHYAPIFNRYILEQNAHLTEGAKEINLAGVLIGNGWYDPLIQYQAFYNYSVDPGNTYNYAPFNGSMKSWMYNNLYGPGNCYDMIVDCNTRGLNDICSYADNFCAYQVQNIFDIVTGRSEFDIRELTPDPFPPKFYVDYLNTPKVQQAIGAYVNFSESNAAVSTAFRNTGDDGRVLTVVTDMKKLIDANLTVVMYTGDADYVCNWLGAEVVSHNIGAPGYEEAGYTDILTTDGIIHGQVKQAGKFSFLRIYEAGHEVPFYKPLVALEMFQRAVAGLDIATGKSAVGKGYLTKGTQKSTYQEGNRTIQTVVVPKGATYNTTTGMPNPFNTTNTSVAKGSEKITRKWLGGTKSRRQKTEDSE